MIKKKKQANKTKKSTAPGQKSAKGKKMKKHSVKQRQRIISLLIILGASIAGWIFGRIFLVR